MNEGEQIYYIYKKTLKVTGITEIFGIIIKNIRTTTPHSTDFNSRTITDFVAMSNAFNNNSII